MYILKNALTNIKRNTVRNLLMGIVFQSFNLLPGLSAIENIILAMNVSGVKDKNKKALAIKLLESVGLNEEKGDRRVLKLSGGEEQRVAIARSIAYDANGILRMSRRVIWIRKRKLILWRFLKIWRSKASV